MVDLQELKRLIQILEQKKSALSDAAEIKAINKEINALQMECGRLKGQKRNEKAFLDSVEREYNDIGCED